ncbi:hypothetical protein Poly30_27320 [Planctomycetes bacterium Poly30]|uniref:NMT1/THI5 like protein n=1 Tax=Saltatorellus ferox TaxID=2528018 RepID=A0A518ET09_9BACT|nr:hypothetical protein Poly30_27320 [Planctomycetes bacterium Poly30]
MTAQEKPLEAGENRSKTPEPESPDRELRRDLLRLWAPLALVTLMGALLAFRWVGPAPPERLAIATGPAGGGYAEAGELFAKALRDAGIEADLVATRGSTENLDLLRRGEVDVALVQGGLAKDEEPELAGLVSLYLEPLWMLATTPITGLAELRGAAVEMGAEGSGTRALAEQLFEAAGVSVEARGGDTETAVASVQSGEAKALLRVAAPRSALVRELIDSEGGLVPASLERAEGIARTLTFLRHVRVHAGSIDLSAGEPTRDIETVAPAATLLARKGLHPAVIGLLVESAGIHFSSRGVLEDEGEFPSLALLDVPPSLAARTALESGPSFLYRAFPFQIAALIDRLKFLILPLMTLLFPLFRIAPPLYRWRIRRRIFRWYGRILALEKRLHEAQATPEELAEAARELDRFDDELYAVSVPLSYADELYSLRLHLKMVREDMRSGRGRWAS